MARTDREAQACKAGEMLFSSNDLAAQLHRDIVPGRLREAFIHARGISSMEHVTAADYDEVLMGDAVDSQKWNQIASGESYFSIYSGFVPFKNVFHLGIGHGRNLRDIKIDPMAMHAALVGACAGLRASFPPSKGPAVAKKDVIGLWVDYGDRSNLKVRFDLHGLGLSGPVTREQANRTLQIMGTVMAAIKERQPVNYHEIRDNLICSAGLKPV